MLYAPFVKGLDNRVPLLAQLNLLTYLLGKAYVSQSHNFRLLVKVSTDTSVIICYVYMHMYIHMQVPPRDFAGYVQATVVLCNSIHIFIQ